MSDLASKYTSLSLEELRMRQGANYDLGESGPREITVTWEKYNQIVEQKKADIKEVYISPEEAMQIWRDTITAKIKKKKERDPSFVFIWDESFKEAYKKIADRYIIGGELKGLWICGNVGCGKSFMMDCFSQFTKTMHSIDPENYKEVILSDVGRFYDGETFGLDDLIAGNRILDDIAKATDFQSYGKWQEPLAKVLWNRHLHWERSGKVTHAVSNVTLDYYINKLTENGAERLADRVRQMFKELRIKKSTTKRV